MPVSGDSGLSLYYPDMEGSAGMDLNEFEEI